MEWKLLKVDRISLLLVTLWSLLFMIVAMLFQRCSVDREARLSLALLCWLRPLGVGLGGQLAFICRDLAGLTLQQGCYNHFRTVNSSLSRAVIRPAEPLPAAARAAAPHWLAGCAGRAAGRLRWSARPAVRPVKLGRNCCKALSYPVLLDTANPGALMLLTLRSPVQQRSRHHPALP